MIPCPVFVILSVVTVWSGTSSPDTTIITPQPISRGPWHRFRQLHAEEDNRGVTVPRPSARAPRADSCRSQYACTQGSSPPTLRQSSVRLVGARRQERLWHYWLDAR